MDVITTSLEALIQRITNCTNQKLDTAAIDAFCVILGKETDGVQIASKLLATHIQSTKENEALQALILLDTCMTRCGRVFHSEVGKFRFLNEMIKLVSPKYLGTKTPPAVRQKVLLMLHTWTREYPRETKIKEAYDMLKKQGVIKDETPSKTDNKNFFTKTQKVKNALFEDEETAKLLQELLQSKDPFELQLANRLIKSMVKDDERRVQQNSQRNLELESAHNNVRLLSEMLDSYDAAQTNTEDIDLMKELHQACERFKPTLLRLAGETQDNEDILGQVLTVNDELSQVFEKYATRINSSSQTTQQLNLNDNDGTALLDLFCSVDNACSIVNEQKNENKTSNQITNIVSTSPQSDMEMLTDIFTTVKDTAEPSLITDSNLLLSNDDIMQPTAIPLKSIAESANLTEKINTKAKALQDLNEIGKQLLQQSLTCTKEKSLDKQKTISTSKLTIELPLTTNLTHVDSIDPFNSNLITTQINQIENCQASNSLDCTVTIPKDSVDEKNNDKITTKPELKITDAKVKPLTDIHVTLADIKPSAIPPMTVINDKNGISVIFHFADGHPRPDVSVIVVTTMSKNTKALTNYLFQAVVPQTCKCRLQQPSGTDLPAHNPFLPPAAITQIMLIANPNKVAVSFKFMLSYTMDDETITEMGEVDALLNA